MINRYCYDFEMVFPGAKSQFEKRRLKYDGRLSMGAIFTGEGVL